MEHYLAPGEKPKKKYAKPPNHKRITRSVLACFRDFAHMIVGDPFAHQGAWRELFAERMGRAADEVAAMPLYVDLGCGKGQFTAHLAASHPDILVLGIDYEEDCVALAAKCVGTPELPNAMVMLASADEMQDMFAPGEVDVLYLNFSTPFPKKKYANLRLTWVDKLISYRGVLSEGGYIDMRTDSQPLFDFSLLQFGCAGYDITWQTRDLYAGGVSELTEYEQRLTAKGARIHSLRARVGELPEDTAYHGKLSLVDFLPADLDAMDYVPLGMEDTIYNLRNQRANLRTKDAQ